MISAEKLTARVDALSEALRDAGVSPDRSARLLGSAATATMNALVLDAVLEENAMPPAQPEPHREPTTIDAVEQPLRVAA